MESGSTVSYCWTADGEPEHCRVEGRDYAGEECCHCRRPIDGHGVRLLADDGDVYDLHSVCARGLCKNSFKALENSAPFRVRARLVPRATRRL